MYQTDSAKSLANVCFKLMEKLSHVSKLQHAKAVTAFSVFAGFNHHLLVAIGAIMVFFLHWKLEAC